MPINSFEITIYHFLCETQVSDEKDSDVLENCVGSDDYRDKDDAWKEGWKKVGEKIYCKSCYKEGNINIEGIKDERK